MRVKDWRERDRALRAALEVGVLPKFVWDVPYFYDLITSIAHRERYPTSAAFLRDKFGVKRLPKGAPAKLDAAWSRIEPMRRSRSYNAQQDRYLQAPRSKEDRADTPCVQSRLHKFKEAGFFRGLEHCEVNVVRSYGDRRPVSFSLHSIFDRRGEVVPYIHLSFMNAEVTVSRWDGAPCVVFERCDDAVLAMRCVGTLMFEWALAVIVDGEVEPCGDIERLRPIDTERTNFDASDADPPWWRPRINSK